MRKVKFLERELDRARERISELEDRLMAQTLGEFRAFRPVAMPVPDEEEEYAYLGDSTGLLRERVRRGE